MPPISPLVADRDFGKTDQPYAGVGADHHKLRRAVDRRDHYDYHDLYDNHNNYDGSYNYVDLHINHNDDRRWVSR